jgi:hypothetical protein
MPNTSVEFIAVITREKEGLSMDMGVGVSMGGVKGIGGCGCSNRGFERIKVLTASSNVRL